MKKITLLFIMLIPVMVFSQSYTGDDFKARNYVRAPLYRTATDTIYRLGGLKADSIYLKGEGLWYKSFASQWTTTGSDIYYNTGNVGIGTNAPSKKLHILSNSDEQVILDANSGQRFTALNFANNGTPKGYIFYDNTNGSFNIAADESEWLALNPNNSNVGVGFGTTAPSYLLHVNGLIGGRNIETNTTSWTTKLGYTAGNVENKTAVRYNTFIGYESGLATTTGDYNVFVGSKSGKANTTGYKNIAIGDEAGLSLTTGHNNTLIGHLAGKVMTDGYYNTFVGAYSTGYSTVSGNRNTYIGVNSGYTNINGTNNVFLGYSAGQYETTSNKLFIDNQDRIDEATARTSALIYGIFHATPASQEVHLNSKVYATHLTSATKGNTLYYDTSTKEISYGATPSGSSTILYSNNIDQVTSGTSETTIYNYDIDGGALLNNGDMIELYIVLVNGNPASTSLVDFLVDTTPVTLFTDLEGISIVRIIINRVSSTSIKYFVSYSYEEGATFGGSMTVTSASSINLTINATASVSTITGRLFYVKNL